MRAGELNGQEQQLINNARSYMVVKANDIIQKSRYTLTAQQQKTLLTMISKIKPDDKAEQQYTLTIKEFCQLCNIDWTSGKNYDSIKQALYGIDKQIMWIKQPDKKREARLRWLNELYINEGSGEIVFSFHKDMFPYLLDLREKYTQYRLINVLPMRSKYAIRLYELLKSYEDMRFITIPTEVLKARMDAEHYDNFKDFRRRVLEKAVEEINAYTDLEVKQEPKKIKSRSYNAVVFTMRKAAGDEETTRMINLYNELW